jgi:type IV secretory pathway VirB4 component
MKNILPKLQIQDNIILTDSSILAIVKIEPIDISLLTDSEQVSFESHIRSMINSIGYHSIQIVVNTRTIEPKDLDAHFSSFNHQDDSRREYVERYISDLSHLVSKQMIPVQDFFIVFKVDCNTNNHQQLLAQLDQLESFVRRTTTHLNRAGISTEILMEDGLELFLKQNSTLQL